MYNTQPILCTLSMINLNGITARTLDLIELEAPLTQSPFGNTVSLLGLNGVGKTTILGAYQLALIADLRYVSLGTSDKFKKAHRLVDSEMFHRLGNPSIVALEVKTRNNEARHLYVIYAQHTSGNHIELTRMRVVLPKETRPMSFLAVQEDNAWRCFTPSMIRDVAASFGCELTTYDAADSYLKDLFSDGVLPKPLMRERELTKFAQVFHSAMSGRLDENIERNLSTYLLSHTRGSIKGVVNILQESMQVVRQTRVELTQNTKDYSFFKQLLLLASDASAYAWAVAEKYLEIADLQLQSAKEESLVANKEFNEAKAKVSHLETSVEELRSERNRIDLQRQSTEEQLRLATKAASEYDRRKRYKDQLEKLVPEVGQARTNQKKAQEYYKEVSEKVDHVSSELAETQEQLADAVKAFEKTQQRAGQYDHACRLLKVVEDFLGKTDPESLSIPIAELAKKKANGANALNKLERQLDQVNEIRDAYESFCKELSLIGEKVSPESLYDWIAAKRQGFPSLQALAANLPYEKEELSRLHSESKSQRKYKAILASSELPKLPESSEEFIQTVSLYRQKVSDLNGLITHAQANIKQLADKYQQTKIILLQTENRHQLWTPLQPSVQILLNAFPDCTDWSKDGCCELQGELATLRFNLNQKISVLNLDIAECQRDLEQLSSRNVDNLELLRNLAEDVDGLTVADLFDDIDPDDARYMEAALGGLTNGILVNDPQTAARELLVNYGQSWPVEDLVLAASETSIDEWREGYCDPKVLFTDLTDQFVGVDEGAEAPWCILKSGEGLRISQLRDNPVLGDKARAKLIASLEERVKIKETACDELITQISLLDRQINALRVVSSQADLAFDREPDKLTAEFNLRQVNQEFEDAKAECDSLESESNKLSNSLDNLLLCEPFVHLLYRDFNREIDDCEAKVKRCEHAKRELERFAPFFQHFDVDWPLLINPYPSDPLKLKQSVQEKNIDYTLVSNQLRDVEALNDVRFHLGPTYIQAKSMLGETSDKQKILKEQARELQSRKEILEAQRKSAESKRDEAQENAHEANAALKQLELDLGHTEAILNDIDIDYFPGLEESLKFEKNNLDSEFKSVQDKSDEYSQLLSQSKEIRQKKSDIAAECIKQIILANEQQEKANVTRQAVIKVIADDDVGAILKDMMVSELKSIDDAEATFQHIRFLVSKVNNCAQSYGVPAIDPMLTFVQKLSGTDLTEVVHLYAESVKLFKRRARRDLIHSGDPQQMLIELDEACRLAQKSLDNAETMFQTKRSELGEAISKRVVDEQRAVRKLSKQLSGIGFGGVAEVRLVTEYVQKFDKVLDALRQGSQVMDDLFEEADSVEEALSDLYYRTTAGEIKGEKLLDHRNYLQVKTQIRRRGCSDFEYLEGEQLSTGERLGSGLVVLISIIKHWAGATHGKKAYAIPLVMDEVSRLDASSQTTVSELCRRCGVQLLMAAPESLGKITGLGYQLVRIWPEGVDLESPSPSSKARSWVQITGLQDGSELTVNSERVLNSIVGDE